MDTQAEDTGPASTRGPSPVSMDTRVRHFSTFLKFIPGIGKSHYFGHADFNGRNYFLIKKCLGGAKNRQKFNFWPKIDKNIYIFIIGINNDTFIL